MAPTIQEVLNEFREHDQRQELWMQRSDDRGERTTQMLEKHNVLLLGEKGDAGLVADNRKQTWNFRLLWSAIVGIITLAGAVIANIFPLGGK